MWSRLRLWVWVLWQQELRWSCSHLRSGPPLWQSSPRTRLPQSQHWAAVWNTQSWALSPPLSALTAAITATLRAAALQAVLGELDESSPRSCLPKIQQLAAEHTCDVTSCMCWQWLLRLHPNYTVGALLCLCVVGLSRFPRLGGPRSCTRLWCRVSRIGVFTSSGCGSGQCTTPSVLIIGKPAHGRASQAESRLLCLSAFPSRQGVLSPPCRMPGLEYPDCGSPFSFPHPFHGWGSTHGNLLSQERRSWSNLFFSVLNPLQVQWFLILC